MTNLVKWGLILGLLVAFSVGCSTEEKKDQAQLHLRIGTAHLMKGHYPQALGELLEAEHLDPSDPVIQNNLGLAYFVRRQFEEAEQHLNKAISLNSHYSDAKNNLGRVYIELARYDDAINILTAVTKDLTYPAPEKAYVNLGLAYMKRGELTTAKNNFKKSLEANNRFCPAYNYYGQTLLQEQKYDDAIDAFETALRLCNNNYDEAHYYGALAYFKAGQREKAQARMEEVIKLYPDSEFATKAKSMLKMMR